MATPQPILKFVKNLHTFCKKQFVLYTTGAGSKSISWLMAVGGASKTVLELGMPYSTAATDDVIGSRPKKYVSRECAEEMAKGAFERAMFLATKTNPNITSSVGSANDVFGVSCTASIISNYQKKGRHCAHVSLYHTKGVKSYSVVLNKDMRDRETEDALVSLLILRGIAEFALPAEVASDVSDFIAYVDGQFMENENVVVQDQPALDNETMLKKFVANEISSPYLVYEQGSLYTSESAPLISKFRGSAPVIVYPGSFNPVHEGHIQLMNTARKIVGDIHNTGNVYSIFEISIQNADKPALDQHTISNRLQQFAGEHCVALSRVPLFIQKAKLFPGCYFVIGSDTAARLVDKKYYQNDDEKVLEAMLEFVQLGCKFIVAGRWDPNTQKFITLKDIRISPSFVNRLFIDIPEEQFRLDISSTELRMQQLRL